MGVRHQARELALQALYACDSKGDWDLEKCLFSLEHFCLQDAAKNYAIELCKNVAANLPALDQKISAISKNWSIPRMSKVDRNIIRLACYELGYTDTPTNIIINEAIELAKEFSATDSTKFVNGILDQIAIATRGSIKVEVLKDSGNVLTVFGEEATIDKEIAKD